MQLEQGQSGTGSKVVAADFWEGMIGLQDPVIFSGSVRENLDPFGSAGGDAPIWQALEQASVAPAIREQVISFMSLNCPQPPSLTHPSLLERSSPTHSLAWANRGTHQHIEQSFGQASDCASSVFTCPLICKGAGPEWTLYPSSRLHCGVHQAARLKDEIMIEYASSPQLRDFHLGEDVKMPVS